MRSGARCAEDGAPGGHDPRARREGPRVGGRTRFGAAEGRERAMTKRAASLLVGLWFLAAATAASAECAWVLWREIKISYLADTGRPNDPVSFSRVDTHWEIDATYTTKDACDSSGKYVGERYGRVQDGQIAREGVVVALRNTRLLCLP